MKIRVLVSDDNLPSAILFQRMLEVAPGIEFIDYSTNHASTRQLIEAHRPDVLAIDYMQPEIDTFIPQIQQDYPELRVLVIASHETCANPPEFINLARMLMIERPILAWCFWRAIQDAYAGKVGCFDVPYPCREFS